MRCREVERLLERYVDGALGREVAERIAAHEVGCAHCRALVARERRAQRALATAPRHPAPVGFAQRVMSELHREALRGTPVSPEPEGAARAYRRLGLGFVLSGALAAAALLLPSALLPWGASADRLAEALKGEGRAAVRSVLLGADSLVRDALRPSADVPGAVEGGRSR